MIPPMKKPRQKTPRSRQLQAQDLTAVVGGHDGTIINENFGARQVVTAETGAAH